MIPMLLGSGFQCGWTTWIFFRQGCIGSKRAWLVSIWWAFFSMTPLSRMNQRVSWSASFPPKRSRFLRTFQSSVRIESIGEFWHRFEKIHHAVFARCCRNERTHVGKNLFPSISVSDVQAWKLDTPIRYLDWHGGSMFFGVEKSQMAPKHEPTRQGSNFVCLLLFGHKKDFNRLQKRSTTNNNNTTQATTQQQNGSTSKDVSTYIGSPRRIGWCLWESGLRLRIGL